jgi:small subunit ribosomal protein S14|tara:strand:- start:1758 stop:2063 length:306 start_codon:yes stop_codon:yes gene_type:complete
MAKRSSIEKNKKRINLSAKDLSKRQVLKDLIMNKNTPIDDRFQAQLKLAKMRRNGARSRIRNRCELTGRPRGYHSRVKLSRIALRQLASQGQIPGMNKSSW